MTRGLILLSASLCLAINPAVAAQKKMTGAELTKLLSGGKVLMLGGAGTGYSGTLTLNADGTGSGSAQTDDKKSTFKMDGKWAIKGDQFCRTWTEIDKGKEVCETWVKAGANKVAVTVKGKKVGVNSWK